MVAHVAIWNLKSMLKRLTSFFKSSSHSLGIRTRVFLRFRPILKLAHAKIEIGYE